NSSLDTPSYHENATGYVLTREAMRWFWRHYLEREEQGKEPLAAPLLAPSLAGLPPALVITAACDPLRDEGEAYAARLRDAVVPGSFHEVGKIAGMAAYDKANELLSLTPSNFIFGRAKMDGRPVVVGGDDFTVRGGSADATIKGKHLMCEQMANEMRLPLIRLVEGSG